MRARRIDGVDLSHYQSKLSIDWEAAKKAGLRFVYHKATESTILTDGMYATRRGECKAAGVPFGAYHFARPLKTPGDATKQAEFFLKTATPEAGDMVPALDLEVNNAKMSEDELTAWVAEWFGVVQTALRHKRALLYTRYNLTRKPGGVSLWVPRYNNDNRLPIVPHPFWTWTVWQFSDGALGNPPSVPGVGHVDINTLNKALPWASVKGLTLPPVAKRRHKPPRVKRPVETDVQRLLRIAGAEVGYHEGRSNGHWNNQQKFSPAVPGLEWSQGQAWCATFVSWVALQAGLADLFPRTASTDAGMAWWKARNEWSEYPAIGAQVYFGKGNNPDHTGIVYDFDADHVYTIEGNTNTNGSREGDGVYRKTRLRRDPYVLGYGYPNTPAHLKTADPNYYRGA